MSHTLNSVNTNTPPTSVQLTINNYATGGEQVTSAELYSPLTQTITAVYFATIPAGQNSLGIPLFPVLTNGKIFLGRVSGGVVSEIPATNNLNAVVNALVMIG
jgi:hypothetical protein